MTDIECKTVEQEADEWVHKEYPHSNSLSGFRYDSGREDAARRGYLAGHTAALSERKNEKDDEPYRGPTYFDIQRDQQEGRRDEDGKEL